MNKQKLYEILTSLPTYGPMYISVTNDGKPYYSEGLPVRFYKKDGTEWVANFKPGLTNFVKVMELKNSLNLLIIAYGTCYIISPNNTTPILVFGVGFTCILEANNDRLVLQDQTDLTIVEPNGTYWVTERISWDGIKELRIENSNVIGLSYDPIVDQWISFKYDLDSRILTGGSYQQYEIKNIEK